LVTFEDFKGITKLSFFGSKVNGLVEPFHHCGFTATYSTFQMALEVVEKRGGYEVAFTWFYSRKKAEAFCIDIIMGKV